MLRPLAHPGYFITHWLQSVRDTKPQTVVIFAQPARLPLNLPKPEPASEIDD